MTKQDRVPSFMKSHHLPLLIFLSLLFFKATALQAMLPPEIAAERSPQENESVLGKEAPGRTWYDFWSELSHDFFGTDGTPNQEVNNDAFFSDEEQNGLAPSTGFSDNLPETPNQDNTMNNVSAGHLNVDPAGSPSSPMLPRADSSHPVGHVPVGGDSSETSVDNSTQHPTHLEQIQKGSTADEEYTPTKDSKADPSAWEEHTIALVPNEEEGTVVSNRNAALTEEGLEVFVVRWISESRESSTTIGQALQDPRVGPRLCDIFQRCYENVKAAQLGGKTLLAVCWINAVEDTFFLLKQAIALLPIDFVLTNINRRRLIDGYRTDAQSDATSMIQSEAQLIFSSIVAKESESPLLEEVLKASKQCLTFRIEAIHAATENDNVLATKITDVADMYRQLSQGKSYLLKLTQAGSKVDADFYAKYLDRYERAFTENVASVGYLNMFSDCENIEKFNMCREAIEKVPNLEREIADCELSIARWETVQRQDLAFIWNNANTAFKIALDFERIRASLLTKALREELPYNKLDGKCWNLERRSDAYREIAQRWVKAASAWEAGNKEGYTFQREQAELCGKIAAIWNAFHNLDKETDFNRSLIKPYANVLALYYEAVYLREEKSTSNWRAQAQELIRKADQAAALTKLRESCVVS